MARKPRNWRNTNCNRRERREKQRAQRLKKHACPVVAKRLYGEFSYPKLKDDFFIKKGTKMAEEKSKKELKMMELGKINKQIYRLIERDLRTNALPCTRRYRAGQGEPPSNRLDLLSFTIIRTCLVGRQVYRSILIFIGMDFFMPGKREVTQMIADKNRR